MSCFDIRHLKSSNARFMSRPKKYFETKCPPPFSASEAGKRYSANASLSPKRSSNVDVMNQGFADEAVVIVKFCADERMVTWGRVKHKTSNRMLEVKGGT
jgi:hypothetical protein